MNRKSGRFTSSPILPIGTGFSQWTIIGLPIQIPTKSGRKTRYPCRCSCGTEKSVDRYHLLSGGSKSCGCCPNNGRRLAPGVRCYNQILWSYKKGAWTKGLEWCLSRDEFVKLVQGPCNYCNAPWSMRYSTALDSIDYNGIDRVDNSHGYILGNCVSCCKTCNHMKSAIVLKDFLSWVARIAVHSLGAILPSKSDSPPHEPASGSSLPSASLSAP